LDSTSLSLRIAESAADRKALDIKVIDVRGRCGYADYLVLASGTSDRHVQSIAELVEKEVKDQGTRSIGREGLREGQWALVDFGDVIFHVFHEFTRPQYDLDTLWQEAPQSRLAPSAGAPAAHLPSSPEQLSSPQPG
jgi:ribosome-associated protein